MPGTLGSTSRVGLLKDCVRGVNAVAFLCAVMMTLMWSSAYAQDGTVTSQLSASTINRDESVTLEIVAIGMDAELDVSSLNKDFEVVGRSSSREVNTTMGLGGGLQTTSVVTWALELVPKDIGVFTVPPVKVGNVSSQSHTLNVNALPSGAKRDIFVEATVDTREPWVQSQVLMTLNVYQAIDIVDGGLDVPEGEDLVVERLGEDIRRNETRDGRQYSVTERRFALFPQKSGEIVLNPITLSVSVPANPTRVRSLFSPTRKLTRRTESITLNVKPRPNSGSAWWLPAKVVQLSSQWIGDVSSAEIDKPLTRTITLRASGVADSQLPEIAMPAIEGASLYAEQPERKLGANQQGLVSELTIKWALIPQRAGELLLPPVTVDWFNTITGRVETATLAEERIRVTAGAVPAGSSGTSSGVGASNTTGDQVAEFSSFDHDRSDSSRSSAVEGNDALARSADTVAADGLAGSNVSEPVSEELTSLRREVIGLESALSWWKWIAAALGLLMLSLMALIWRSKATMGDMFSSLRPLRQPLGAVRNASDETVSRLYPLSGVAVSCKAGKLEEIKASLLEWAARQWPENPPSSLDGLKKRLPESEASAMIQQLDATLYGHGRDVESMKALQNTLASLPEALKKSVDSKSSDAESAYRSVSSSTTNGLPSL